ncbi:RagB/SusD family nutrient uptake outer membrane protein [Mucilaginibacter aquariorum]|uniref:RagB/SusD family nutrient uptake outer membrane protein n=1 Tax=Mucilaginibacter aquariorum TaxID=2967225 RepID=A0ABT1SZH1_9SPHI|nr:RagB/SusD family nutrient uptake outer membrane protein [Mucilaginibacter aquariorum]MCQ6957744.1 RagB/SusD family nutrient uptake outer membrane protein [Mucilaginibacter aquariorum]
MKIKSYQILRISLITIALHCSYGCKRDFLKPDPLSVYEPGVTFTTKEGLQAAITACNRNLTHVWYGENAPILTDMLFSEEAVSGITDKSGPAQDLNAVITPTSNNDDINTNHINYFWHEGYNGIKYANTVISNVDRVPGLDPTLKDQMLGMAYFHRAFRYLWLVFDFGDVPFLTQAVSSPKVNYKSTKASVILQKITSDMEFAVEHVPAVGDFGGVNKGACQQLLIKCYLATGQFDKAIATADNLINSSGYSLMTNSFGTFVNPMPNIHNITRNVIWDLHRSQNKSISANKESIMTLVSREELANSRQDMYTMRNATPYYSGTGTQLIITPNGNAGMSSSYKATNGKIDIRKTYGRGIAHSRGTWYSNHAIWDDTDDLRHSRATGNWMNMEDLVYNNPTLQTLKNPDPYYGKNLQLYNDAGKLLIADTVRTWFDWPHYKLFVESPRSETQDNYNGGAGDWYVYRLAETYLLRAEAHFWKGELALAAADVNTIRSRAKCTKMYTAGEMTMGKIMDERCRELYYEELRHMELSRVSYIFATTHKSDEFGKTYTVENLSKDSYWYNRVITYNDFYRKRVKTTYGTTFSISPYHILWPVPQGDIDANSGGRVNQNFGYSGYEKNVAPYDNLEDAIAGEK